MNSPAVDDALNDYDNPIAKKSRRGEPLLFSFVPVGKSVQIKITTKRGRVLFTGAKHRKHLKAYDDLLMMQNRPLKLKD